MLSNAILLIMGHGMKDHLSDCHYITVSKSKVDEHKMVQKGALTDISHESAVFFFAILSSWPNTDQQYS